MDHQSPLRVTLRSQTLGQDARGYTAWAEVTTPAVVATRQTALLLCDVWDRHWCRGANERLATLLPRMSETVTRLRERGVLIIHAPSETMSFYAGTPARERVLAIPRVTPPQLAPHAAPPLPVDASDEGCDTGEPPAQAWSRQHPAVTIDQERDVISDDGAELFNLYTHQGITMILIMGVHTNMCILNRSFAIKALVRWGFNVALVRDLTDTMYNPAMPPYVAHDQGTALVVDYIEKFWCPSVSSADLLS